MSTVLRTPTTRALRVMTGGALVAIALSAGCTKSVEVVDADRSLADAAPSDAAPADAGASDASTSGILPVTVAASDLVRAHPAAPGGQTDEYVDRADDLPLDDDVPSRVLEAPPGALNSEWAALTAALPIDARHHGRRFRMRAQVRTVGAGAAFLWLRIDAEGPSFVLDNMANPIDRTLRGTTGWREVALVLDVPSTAYRFAFGSGLLGAGSVSVGTITLEEVDRTVPTTPHFTGP